MKIFIVYLLAVNLYGIYIMYNDKQRAKKGTWRVPESKLFAVAMLFGSLGVMIGMKKFRHKTKHYRFVYGIPIIFIFQLLLLYKVISLI